MDRLHQRIGVAGQKGVAVALRLLSPDTGEAGHRLVVHRKPDFLAAGARLWLGEPVERDQAAMFGLVDDIAVERAFQVADIGGVHLSGGAGALALAGPREAPVHGLGDLLSVDHPDDGALSPGPDILCRAVEPEMADIVGPALDSLERAGDIAVMVAHRGFMAPARRGVQRVKFGGLSLLFLAVPLRMAQATKASPKLSQAERPISAC